MNKHDDTDPRTAVSKSAAQSIVSAAEFAERCAGLNICPACLNHGESHDHDLDIYGNCENCGHQAH